MVTERGTSDPAPRSAKKSIARIHAETANPHKHSVREFVDDVTDGTLRVT